MEGGPENAETSEAQDAEASDAEMSGYGSKSESAIPSDEEAVEDLKTSQKTHVTCSEKALENNIPDAVYSTAFL